MSSLQHIFTHYVLISGSTGNLKALRLRQNQSLAAFRSKLAFRVLPLGETSLNRIGLDYVASMKEIHLTAMRLGVDQIHL